MKVKDVLSQYNLQIPFPWTLQKIREAGFDPAELFLDIGNELRYCEDVDTPLADALLVSITKLEESL